MLRMACGHRRFLPYLQDAVPVLLLLAAPLRRRGKVGNGGGTPSRKPLPRPALKGRVLQPFLRAGGEDTLEVRPRGREGGSVVQRRWGVVAVAAFSLSSRQAPTGRRLPRHALRNRRRRSRPAKAAAPGGTLRERLRR